MSEFTALSMELRYALSGVLFLSAFAVFVLALYQFSFSSNIRHCLPTGLWCVGLVILLSYLAASSMNQTLHYLVKLPYAVVIVISIGSLIFAVCGMIKERKKHLTQVSPNAIRQALDNLNSGICFSDETGKIILMNHTMAHLIDAISGTRAQIYQDIIDSLGTSDGVIKTETGDWQIHTHILEKKHLNGVVQTIAYDVSELMRANEQLERENEKLRQTNEELKQMLEIISDRIRQTENLNLKMQIHNDIGTSLIYMTNILSEHSNQSVHAELAQLQNAVSHFSNNRTRLESDLQRICDNALLMGIDVEWQGEIPADERVRRITAAALKECVTNCINHAKGKHVYVHTEQQEDSWKLRFTNDGNKPDKPFTEGGGLGSLRKTVVLAGGSMRIMTQPEFILEITC